MPLINLKHAATLVDGLDHPEGVAYGPDGRIYAGGEDGQLYRIDLESRHVDHFATTQGLNLGMAHDAAGNTYVCNPGSGAVMRATPQGETTVYSQGNAERSMTTPNYPAFDASGSLYVCDSGQWKADNGCIWSIAPGGTTTLIDTDCHHFPNGCAVSPDGRYLYVAMSLNPPRVVRFPIDAGRKVGEVETVVELPHTVPDGLAFCTDGSLLVSCYRPDTVFRILPAGEVTVLMDDYEGTALGAPTNVCFGGPELSILFWANLGRWHIGMLPFEAHGLRGAGVFYPQLD
jgi:gluconolactonase